MRRHIEFDRRLPRTLLALAFVAGSCAVAHAESDRDEATERSNWAIGLTGGTLGFGGEIAVRVHPNVIVRATGSMGSYATFIDLGGIASESFFVQTGAFTTQTLEQSWSVKPSVSSGGVILDVHLFRDGSRISGGLRYFDFAFDAKLTPSDPTRIRVGNSTYTVPATSTVTAKITNDQPFVPYLGLGYDSTFFKNYGFSLSLDAGAVLGAKPKSELSITGFTPTAVDRDLMQKKLENSFGLLQYYPVLMLSAKYRY